MSMSSMGTLITVACVPHKKRIKDDFRKNLNFVYPFNTQHYSTFVILCKSTKFPFKWIRNKNAISTKEQHKKPSPT